MIHHNGNPLMSKCASLFNIISKLTLSKALVRSKKTLTAIPPYPRSQPQTMASVADLPCLNAR